jgi:hypothetical protein
MDWDEMSNRNSGLSQAILVSDWLISKNLFL